MHTRLLDEPLALLWRQAPPDVPQCEGGPDGAKTATEARHAPHIARSRYFLPRLAARAAIVLAVGGAGFAT
jgi:hypothetical protein